VKVMGHGDLLKVSAMEALKRLVLFPDFKSGGR
jgi:hypothetical protein